MGPNSPEKFDDYVYQDRSLLGLHIVSFSDATLVVLNWIHAAFDAMAKKAILEAWILMIQGKDDEVPRPVSYREDLLGHLGKNPVVPHKLADQKMSPLAKVGWLLNNVVDRFWRRHEMRVLFLPADFIETLRDNTLKDMAMGWGPGKEAWVSEGDILFAWLAKIATCHLPPDSNKTVSISQQHIRYISFLTLQI